MLLHVPVDGGPLLLPVGAERRIQRERGLRVLAILRAQGRPDLDLYSLVEVAPPEVGQEPPEVGEEEEECLKRIRQK